MPFPFADRRHNDSVAIMARIIVISIMGDV